MISFLKIDLAQPFPKVEKVDLAQPFPKVVLVALNSSLSRLTRFRIIATI
jgi:hypothetical protein